jgi:hypothetical protein
MKTFTIVTSDNTGKIVHATLGAEDASKMLEGSKDALVFKGEPVPYSVGVRIGGKVKTIDKKTTAKK